MRDTTHEYCWLGFGLAGAVAWLSTPYRGTHQMFARGRVTNFTSSHTHTLP